MAFLCLLAFLATWGLMWRWVVKNRGNWNLFFGNVLGAGAGFIVGVVVFSISLALFTPELKTAKKQVQETVTQEVAPAAPKPEPVPAPAPVAVAPPAPAPIPAPAPAPAPALDNFPAFVAGKPQNEPSPPESALLPNYSSRLTSTVFEKPITDALGQDFVALRKMLGKDPEADKSMMAAVMCAPFLHSAMRFPATTVVAPQITNKNQRFKDQIYTISNNVSARNMLGDDVSYRYTCTVQPVAGSTAENTEWRLLDLKLKKAES
ncbi:hypothetical protein [Pseudomonas sp. GM80]|uniref:hypothetical protein n=1 Tax=Pseudomonas sp. GM80 TaxID=1144339 RepID=UPI00026F71FC|nr:hypothetical protein [Pseudomonas sp. GM80]EJN25121.1 hypothetical protein PMI37_04338 [Pseudomonas sp. GM80]